MEKVYKEMFDNTLIDNYSYGQRAEYIFNWIQEVFGLKGNNLFSEHYPSLPEDNIVSFLWPYSGLLSAINVLITLPEYKDKYYSLFLNIIGNLECYLDSNRLPVAYQALPEFAGGSDRFYDDNEWLGLDFIEAYQTTKNIQYLEKAILIFDFIKSGWSDELDGGIYWCEQKRDTKNTCSNGPAIVLALGLYDITGEKVYLEWALKIYNWTSSKLQSPEGIYWDNIDLNGNIDSTTYTYNSGSMLHSAVLLYKVTLDKNYLSEAQRIADASYRHFINTDQNEKNFFSEECRWFTAILFRGYVALYEIDRIPKFIDAIVSNIDYHWLNFSYLYRSGEKQEDVEWLLNEACMVEINARTAKIKAKGDMFNEQ